MTTPTGSAAGTVKRYDCTNGGAQHCYGCYQMTRDDVDGEYVLATDFDALAAERDALAKQLANALAHTKLDMEMLTAAQSSEEGLREALEIATRALRAISGDSWQDADGVFRPMLRTTRKEFADKALSDLAALSTHPSAREQHPAEGQKL
jgi:polyhydroxyalkanoate synthesis regulator protein